LRVSSTIPYKFIIIAGIAVLVAAATTIAYFSNKPKKIEYATSTPLPAPTPEKSPESTPTPTPSPIAVSPASQTPESTAIQDVATPTQDSSTDSLSPISQISAEDSGNASSPSNQSSNQVPKGVKEFFDKWLHDHVSNNPNDIANHYTNGAYYCYVNGPTTRQYIYDDFLKLIKRYPIRSYNNISVDSVIVQSPDSVKIKYHFNYMYRGKKVASGSSSVDISIRNIGGQWLITSFSEIVNRN
jgi:hypothetical protein